VASICATTILSTGHNHSRVHVFLDFMFDHWWVCGSKNFQKFVIEILHHGISTHSCHKPEARAHTSYELFCSIRASSICLKTCSSTGTELVWCYHLANL